VRTRLLRARGHGCPLIFLHGYSDSADTWRTLIARLPGREAVAVDLPGFGMATRPPPSPLLPAVDEFVADLVRSEARGGRVLLVGNSLGGVAALRAAQDPTLPLAGIAPISPAGLGHAPWVDLLSREPLLHRITSLPVPLPRPVIRRAAALALARLAFADHRRVDPEFFQHYTSHLHSRADIVAIVAGARSLLAELRLGYKDLAGITCPVLLIWGLKDRLVPPAGAERVLRAVPGSRLAVLEECGHCAHAEDPQRVAALLIHFARRCEAQASSAERA
jgi:pimeloyl-ACP methyl ester carboxylesterase